MFAFALGVAMSTIFTLVHNGDRASQELFINNYFGRCASTVATSIHATHVVMCGMFVRVQAGIYYYSGLTTESVIMMTYCHMVEVLWLVIMTTTMLSHTVPCLSWCALPRQCS
jgi:heme/copper-type cytochrome/quinol oxidase subunit 3